MTDALVAIGCVLLTGGLAFVGWLMKQILDIRTDIAGIKAQHVNNGGSTLRDAIDRVDARTTGLDAKLDEHLTQSAADSALLHQHLNGGH